MKIVSHDDENVAIKLKKLAYLYSAAYAAFERKRGFGYYILSDDTQRIFVPFKLSYRRGFNIGLFPFAPQTSGVELTAEEEKSFMKNALEYVKAQFNCIRIEPGPAISVFKLPPDNAKSTEMGMFGVNLQKSEEELFAAFNPTYRNEIRNAEKNNIEIRYGKTELEAFYQCYADTHKKQGAAHEPFDFFKEFYESMTEDYVICATAYVNNVADAGVFIAYSSCAGFYMYAGSATNPQLKGSTKKILWECMKLMKTRGSKKFVLGGARTKNVEGTKFEGIQNFKRRFGAEVTDGYMWKMDLNKPMCIAYDLLFRIRCMLSGQKAPKDIVDSQM